MSKVKIAKKLTNPETTIPNNLLKFDENLSRQSRVIVWHVNRDWQTDRQQHTIICPI